MEIPLSFGGASGAVIEGLLITPSGFSRPPVAILCGGEAPQTDGPNRQIADYLQSEGIASLLLDFPVHGVPDEPAPTAIAEWMGDLQLAMDALESLSGVAAESVGIFGIGVAGTVGLLAAARDARIRALVLRSAPAPILTPTASVAAPTLIVLGADDSPMRAEAVRLERWLSGGYELRIVPRADRHFTDPIAFNRVARDTVAWFTHHLGTGRLTRRA
jgi:putative phosphoribosyl transferase